MDYMKLVDILGDIIYPEIIEFDDITNVEYFKTRMKTEPIGEELINEAIGILDELLNTEELEKQINKSQDKQKRRKNLNELVDLCEKIAGVDKKSNQ